MILLCSKVNLSGKRASTALAFLSGIFVGCYLSATIYERKRKLKNEPNKKVQNEKGSNPQNASGLNTKKYSSQLKAKEFLWEIVEHTFTGSLLYVSDQLHLFDILYENFYDTRTEICTFTVDQVSQIQLEGSGFSKRWLMELFVQFTASGIFGYDPQTNQYKFHNEFIPLLRDPTKSTKDSIVAIYQLLHNLLTQNRINATKQSLQTGIGITYDFNNQPQTQKEAKDLILSIDRKNANFFKYNLIPDVLQKIVLPQTGELLMDLLNHGGDNINVADVGCGCGVSTIELAKKFPNCHFYAYESSLISLQIMKERVEEQNLINITICDVSKHTLGDGPFNSTSNDKFNFIYAHDVLHDMTNPKELIQDVKKALHPESGCWVIVDVKCGLNNNDVMDKVNTNGCAIAMGFSCFLCLASSTSGSASSEGLGTMGFSANLAKRWMRQYGNFKFFQQMDIPSLPSNICFVVA